MTTRLLIGHVLEKLGELADESVHCVVTSPPYYGLRDYGIEPQVWGGPTNRRLSTSNPVCQPGCEHQWGDERQITKSGGTGKSTLMNDGRPDEVRQRIAAGTVKAISFNSSTGAFCRHCNAWRGSLGLEPTPALYVEHMVAVFREVRRVLRSDGTLWLNIGDSYCSTDKWGGGKSGNAGKHTVSDSGDVPSWAVRERKQKMPGVKPKDLLGVPWMLAFALRDDGWYLRSEITWAKRAPMPESVTDRPTTATEKVFLLAKSARYFYDAEAVKEDASEDSHGSPNINPGIKGELLKGERAATTLGKWQPGQNTKRNMRNWWLLGPEPFPEAHFATFPTEIPRRAILAGTKPGDTILDPFFGAGTVGLVADQLQRDCIGIELNPEYAAMAQRRIIEDAPLLAAVAAE